MARTADRHPTADMVRQAILAVMAAMEWEVEMGAPVVRVAGGPMVAVEGMEVMEFKEVERAVVVEMVELEQTVLEEGMAATHWEGAVMVVAAAMAVAVDEVDLEGMVDPEPEVVMEGGAGMAIDSCAI